MLINNIDISSLGIKLNNRVITSNSVDTVEEWLDGDIQPTLIRQQDRFKNITLDFLILTPNEEEAYLRISKLTQMLKKATIQFDDLNLLFDVSLVGNAMPSRLKNGNFIVSYNLTGDYAKGAREVYTTNANMTNSFKLTVVYYQNSTTLLATESVTIRASSFEGVDDTLDSIGVDVNKYLPKYYNNGIATNLNGIELTYENLLGLNALIINYSPIGYNLNLAYFVDDGTGYYNELINNTIVFTYPQIKSMTSIGQLIDAKTYKPDGYKATIKYDGELTVEDLLAASPIYIYYTKLQIEQSKNITLTFEKENDIGGFDIIQVAGINVKESDFIVGMRLTDLVNIDSFRPDKIHYNSGYVVNHNIDQNIDYETIDTTYTIRYTLATNTLFVEYYVGTYPDWYRLTTTTITTKYKSTFDNSFNVLTDLNLDLNKYHTNEYEEGLLYNQNSYTTYNEVLNAGVLQVYYKPIDFTLVVRYYVGDTLNIPTEEQITINALMFLSNPILGDIVPITAHRPEGYQFSPLLSYDGEVSLSALTQASPINIVYEEIVELKTKNIIVKYKKELSSAYTTINTSLITINEADVVGGVRLKDIINLNLYQPEYYENGIIDGYSSTALLDYESINSSYDVLYVASSYSTPVRYYTDEVNDLNWIGSSNISYRVIDFETTTTLFDLGLNLNAFKPAYCGDGELQYTGPVNFTALQDLDAINVIYWTEVEPDDPDGIDYPHRFLFLQHNDLGDYENLHPEWTMNHAFINTGVSADDMSKLTVIMECERVDEYVPLHEVNEGYAYLFGSSSPLGSYFMRFNNQTQYGTGLTGVNTYEAKAGNTSNILTLTEESAIGFGANSGIYASAQEGYSNVVFTYTNRLQTDKAQMPYPLYLFANNKSGSYDDGLAGIGIYSCRIYYEDNLIRDLIPVQFYDKIGEQIAPSNCLYDKVSQTFFEDGTKLNSFNIIDDDRFTDDNLEHQIGHCYINYYKGTTLFQTIAVWFRGNDFGEGKTWDPYTNFMVDKYQPAYYSPGVIKEMENEFIVNFDNLNNQTFTVVYEEQKNSIVVNYIKEDENGNREILAEEIVPLSEKDFYQVPTFGDLVRLNKYKPEGYETDFVYEGKRVSLARVLDLSPYEIVYHPIDDEIKTYTTIIRYIKKVFGIRTYEAIGTKTITLNQSDFRDGEYIDFWIDKNAMKPEKYYLDGQTYEWYEMDERLDSPENLKEVYTIWYAPETQYIDVNYYTDDFDEANLIASTTWSFAIDSYEYPIQLTDTLPNDYINKYKPVVCGGGVLKNPTEWYNFEDLVNLEEIAIMYETIEEPDDPEQAYYEQKVLYWGYDDWAATDIISQLQDVAGRIPYMDLGYRPKEIGRLRVEFTGNILGLGYTQNEMLPAAGGRPQNHSWQGFDYLNFFGYYAPEDIKDGDSDAGLGNFTTSIGETFTSADGYTSFSRKSKGAFALTTRIPVVSGWVQTAEGPQFIDGYNWYSANAGAGVISHNPPMKYSGIIGCYRRGVHKTYDDDYNVISAFENYGIGEKNEIPGSGYNRGWPCCFDRTGQMGEEVATAKASPIGNPYTIILDAYNDYAEIYSKYHGNNSYQVQFENVDNDFFVGREQPKGPLSLFSATDPNTGKINVMPFCPMLYPSISPIGTGMQLQGSAATNPYGAGENYGSITIETLVGTGTDAAGNVIYETVTQTKNIYYANFPMPKYPQIGGGSVWGLKIYDRDRLVRDLIPVAEGDKIYDYIMPANGLFDLVTEIFFGNSNVGGTYTYSGSFISQEDGSIDKATQTRTITPEEILPLKVMYDPMIYGKIINNYYDWDNTFIDNQFVDVPTYIMSDVEPIEDVLGFNDMKPDEFHLDGMIDLDADLSFESLTLKQIYEMGSANIYYKLRTFTKTIVYYQDDYRIGSKDVFYSIEDIENANSLEDLGIDVDLYYNENFKHGRIVFDESIIASNDIQAFIDAPSPIVVYDKLTKEEAPHLLYQEYYRGGAYETDLITIDEDNPNYLDCNLDGVILNPNGAIKYYNHYHSALYEDEDFGYFIPYQVRVINKYAGIHRGPARRYPTLAMIIVKDVYTIIEERNGWGRLKEYPVGWIKLDATEPITGPGQNPDYDVPDAATATIAFATNVHISKLTIDRLWCYVPEVESWIKAEDVSFNQAGKLYNALGLSVINLNDIDFSALPESPSLSDIGIYPEAKVLRFHNYTNYVYDGDYTYEAFSNLHQFDFVYPETIYNYTCIYYKDNIGEYEEVEVVQDGSTIVTTHTNEIGRAAFSCSISDWNPDWDTFIATSWQVDEDGNPLNPKLYRDTELSLTWDYFGFERNLYRPTGYAEGIYIWNPRTWEKNNEIHFTFNELIRCGTQKVFYPIFEPDTYKIWIQNNVLGTASTDSVYGTSQAYNPGISVDLTNKEIKQFYSGVPGTDNRFYDIVCETEVSDYEERYSRGLMGLGNRFGIYSQSSSNKIGTYIYAPYIWTMNNNYHRTYDLNNLNDSCIISVSNFRDQVPSVVLGFSEFRKEAPYNYYYVSDNGRTDWDRSLNYTLINENTNLQQENTVFSLVSNPNIDYRYFYLDRTSVPTTIQAGENVSHDKCWKGIIHSIQSYYQFDMIHYWVPVPKGLWYIYNGKTLRIPDNGLFDLLTGDFSRSYRFEDGEASVVTASGASFTLTRDLAEGKDLIFRKLQEANEENAYDYFNGWVYNTTDIDYIVSIDVKSPTFVHPDLYATKNRELTSGLIMPVSKLCADQENKVVGEWYYGAGQWFESKNTSIFAGNFDKLKLTKLHQEVCLINDENNSINFYTYLNPADVTEIGESSDYSYGTRAKVLTTYYYYDSDIGRFYFDGAYWVPESYTSRNIIEVNKNYAISRDTNYYSVPIASNEYKLGIYLYGERVTVPYVSNNNPNWAYTGSGWIELLGNTSEVE